MRRVAQQRDPAVAPARQRIAVAHRIFPKLVGRLDQSLGIDIRDTDSAHVRHQFLEAARARPILLLRRWEGPVADPADDRPIGQPLVGPGSLRNRINHEFCGEPSSYDHRTSGEEQRPIDRAAPQHQAVPARRPFIGKQFVADHRMDAVGADQHVAAGRIPMRTAAVEEIGVTPPSSWVNEPRRQPK